MPFFVAALLGGLIEIAASMLGRALLALGLGWVSYQGVRVTIDYLKAEALSALSGVSAQMLGLMAYLKVGEFISIIFSALLVRLLLNGLSSGGAIYKLVRK